MKSNAPSPIAIVGMSCRMPGGANNPEKLWSLICEGRSAWSDVPSDRFNWKSFYHPSSGRQGTTNHRGGHFLDHDIATFDAAFFGISPSEANAIDPQQRIQLECAYEALENAGMPLESVRGSNTAVYVATFSRDYDRVTSKDNINLPRYHMTGVGDAIASNRISYLFDLKGPSITLDTGCSGSLVALSLACQSLRTGESNMALVGGTNLILSPDSMISMSLLGILNEDGRCYAFDSRGSGYGRGEGAATIVLKRLEDALLARDSIRAVIHDVGVNQDGKTSGITLPSQDAQERLIDSVFARTGLSTNSVDYIEAHGTGTAAGDSAEIRSIAKSFCNERSTPLIIGSIKSNIGHLESASGLAGLIKTVLILEKGIIPPNVNLETLKADVNLKTNQLKIPRKLERWPNTRGGPRYASVNSFGYGGTNAHLLLGNVIATSLQSEGSTAKVLPNDNTDQVQTALSVDERLALDESIDDNLHIEDGVRKLCEPISTNELPYLLVMSARSKSSSAEMVRNLAQWASSRTTHRNDLSHLAYTLSLRRSILEWRFSLVASSYQEISSSIEGPHRISRASPTTSITFLFTGQGAQWPRMGHELLHTYPQFRRSLRTCEEILCHLGASWSLTEELLRDPSTSNLNNSSIAQPTTTALQIALVDLMHSFGIKAGMVVGHSSGEIASAYAARVLSRADAMRISFHRGSVVRTQNLGEGAMLAVGLPKNETLAYMSLVKHGTISIACVNSPMSTTVSGDKPAVSELRSLLDKDSIFNRTLAVDVAYHSYHMSEIAEDYFKLLGGVGGGTTASDVRFISSLTGRQQTTNFGPSYWVQNLVSQVDFLAALNTIQAELADTYDSSAVHLLIELGPHSALNGPTRQSIKQAASALSECHYLPSLTRGHDALRDILQLSGNVFEFGYPVNINAVNALRDSEGTATVIQDLPPYPWDHGSRYWHESRLSKNYRFSEHPYHDLLGHRAVTGGSDDYLWRNSISVEILPWLLDHSIGNQLVYPGSAYLCMAIEAALQVFSARPRGEAIDRISMRDIAFLKPLRIPESLDKTEVELRLTPRYGQQGGNMREWSDFRVSSYSSDGVVSEHCRGVIVARSCAPTEMKAWNRISTNPAAKETLQYSIEEQHSEKVEKMEKGEFYGQLRSNGNLYGPAFAILEAYEMTNLQAGAKFRIPDFSVAAPHSPSTFQIIHPATLDAIFHLTIPLFLRHQSLGEVMPTSIGEITISTHVPKEVGEWVLLDARLDSVHPRTATADVSAFRLNEQSHRDPVVSISQLEISATGESPIVASDFQNGKNMMRLEWRPDIDFITAKIDSVYTSPENGDTRLERKCKNLDRIALFYSKLCINAFEKGELIPCNNVATHLLEWMRKYSAIDNHQCSFPGSTITTPVNPALELASHGVEGEALHRIGENLIRILTGQIDPLSLLLEAGLLQRFYSEDEFASKCSSHLVGFLQHLFFKKHFLKILEIGAGTGGTTLPLLKSLGGNKQAVKLYDFTDVSSGFFGPAKSLLSDWLDLVQFKTLDIEKEPSDQGFEEGSYDLIIASNVLHATSRIDTTLQNVQKLLRPGGRLALIEVTRLVPFLNVVAGVLPGWWKGYEDGREDSPLLTVEQWHNSLRRNGFDEIDNTMRDFESPLSIATLMVAKASETSKLTLSSPVRMLSTSNSPGSCYNVRAGLLDALETQGLECHCSSLFAHNRWDESVYVILDSGERPLLSRSHSQDFAHVIRLLSNSKRVLWVSLREDEPTEESYGALVTGLARVARSEYEGLRLIAVDVQQKMDSSSHKVVQFLSKIVSTSFGSGAQERDTEFEYIYRGDSVLIPRLIPDRRIQSSIEEFAGEAGATSDLFHQVHRPLKLQIQRPGVLDSIVFVDDASTLEPLQADQLEVQAKAFGVNFKDVFVALGRMKASTKMVGECAGLVTAIGSNIQADFQIGDRVCGWNGTPYASTVRMNATDTYKLPSSMSLAIGSSIPVVFITAYHSLLNIANLQRGQSVLINSASGGVGQAAVMIAQNLGAEIFATASTKEKRRLLVNEYSLPETHVFQFSPSHFRQTIIQLTKGRGVDVVLNSLSGVALHESWRCIAQFGVFIELGKTDIYQDNQIDMDPFDRNASFTSVDLTALAKHRPKVLRHTFAEILKMFQEGSLRPVQPTTVLGLSDIGDAFRSIQARKHTGKFVLEALEDTTVRVQLPKPSPLQLANDATYIVAGGLGDVGRHVCRLMASRGAGHLLIPARTMPHSEERRKFETDLASRGARAHILRCDISDEEAVQAMKRHCQKSLPVVKGIIQAAMVLQDRALEHMSSEDFHAALEPKYYGTNHLKKTFEASSVDFFIMLSSVSGILGVKSQSNYAAASAFQDLLAHNSVACATHYLSLDIGMIEDSQSILSRPERRSNLLRAGTFPLKLEQILCLLEFSMTAQARRDRHAQIITGFDRQSLKKYNCDRTLRDPLFSHLPTDDISGVSEFKDHVVRSLNADIATTKDMEEVKSIVYIALTNFLSTLVALELQDMRLDMPISELGLDSLIAIELRNWTSRTLKASLRITDIFDTTDLRDLVDKIVQRSSYIK